jgi:hypothetical protein
MERIMEFKITEAEAREMAKFEEEAGCDLSAGADWGIDLDKVIELALNPVVRGKFIEEVASSFQLQIQERLANKIRR